MIGKNREEYDYIKSSTPINYFKNELLSGDLLLLNYNKKKERPIRRHETPEICYSTNLNNELYKQKDIYNSVNRVTSKLNVSPEKSGNYMKYQDDLNKTSNLKKSLTKPFYQKAKI